MDTTGSLFYWEIETLSVRERQVEKAIIELTGNRFIRYDIASLRLTLPYRILPSPLILLSAPYRIGQREY